jgi:hypothetical protein
MQDSGLPEMNRGNIKEIPSSMRCHMRRNYDIFEKFRDGSIVWRASTRGKFEAKQKIQELMELSDNEFVVIDDPVEFISAKTMRSISRPSTKTVTHG